MISSFFANIFSLYYLSYSCISVFSLFPLSISLILHVSSLFSPFFDSFLSFKSASFCLPLSSLSCRSLSRFQSAKVCFFLSLPVCIFSPSHPSSQSHWLSHIPFHPVFAFFSFRCIFPRLSRFVALFLSFSLFLFSSRFSFVFSICLRVILFYNKWHCRASSAIVALCFLVSSSHVCLSPAPSQAKLPRPAQTSARPSSPLICYPFLFSLPPAIHKKEGENCTLISATPLTIRNDSKKWAEPTMPHFARKSGYSNSIVLLW